MKQVLLVLGSLLVATLANAASFDCAKAATNIEKMICDNPKASSSDDLVDLAYRRALERTDDRHKLQDDQRRWLKGVRNKCADADCLYTAQVKRAYALDDIPAHKCYWLEPPRKDSSGNRPAIEPICRTMEANLNQFCDRPPMVCKLQIAPKFGRQITLPTWTSLDPEANRALIEEFLRAPYDGNAKNKYTDLVLAEQKSQLDAAFSGKRITFSEAQLDLYNLGKPQLAYRLDYGNCQADNPQLNDPAQWAMPTHYAEIKTQFAPNIVRSLFKEYFSVDNFLGNVFLYEGKVYDYWMSGTMNPATGLGDNQLVMNHHGPKEIGGSTDLVMRNICVFNYQPMH